MSVEAKWMHSISCDYPGGCSAELENDYGGAWLYDSPREAREAAYDADWATDVEGKDFCERHRPDDTDSAEPTGRRASDVQLAIFDPADPAPSEVFERNFAQLQELGYPGEPS